MTWVGAVILLLAWFACLVLIHEQVVNLLLIGAAGLLVARLIDEREHGA